MVNLKTTGNGPQGGRNYSESHTPIVCLAASGGGKNSFLIEKTRNSKRKLKQQKLVNLTEETWP